MAHGGSGETKDRRLMSRRPMPPLLAALVATWPEPGKPFPAAEREASIAMQRNAWDVVFGPVERPTAGQLRRENWEAGQRVDDAARIAGPKLYVIKEDGSAHCDGLPMALKDLPQTVTFIDKRGAFDDQKFAWESILWADIGAVPPGTARPAGLTLAPKTAGDKLRANGSDDVEVLT
jgi:hypothetical protein